MKKYIPWINADTPIAKQTNQDWNTSIHLENNGPSIKIPLIYWFFIMTFSLCFYRNLWVIGNNSGNIGNNSGHIGLSHSRFPKCLWMIDAEWNAHRLTSLLTCSINYSLTNISSTLPPEKNNVLHRKVDNFVYLKKNFNLLKI